MSRSGAALSAGSAGGYKGAWQATTAYKAGDLVKAPDGSIQAAKVDFTSGASFSQANWNSVYGAGAVWNVLDHGVAGDGVTDDGQAIKAFLNACFAAGGVAYFPARQYLHDSITGTTYTDGFSHFYVNFAPRIVADPGATILCKFNGDAWNFGQPTQPSTQHLLTQDAPKGSYVIKIDSTAGINADDLVKIGDTATIVGVNSGTGAYQGAANNLYRVKSVDSPTQITLGDPLIYAMTVANGAYLALTDVKDRCFIKGLAFKNIGAATNTASALQLWYCRRVDIDVSGEYFGGPGIQLQGVYEGRVKHDAKHYYDIAQTGNSGQFGYGVDVGDMCVNLEVDVTADQCRHSVSVAGIGADNIRITGVSKGATTTHWDAHGGATNVLFDNVIASGGAPGAGGIALRGDRYRIRGGVVDSVPGIGVFIFDGCKDVEVKGTSITNSGGGAGGSGGAGIHVSCPHNFAGVTIEGCNIDNVGGPGIDFNFSPPGSLVYSDIRIVNTVIRNVTGAAVDIRNALNRARIKGVLVEDNQGTPTTTAGVNCTVAATDLTADVECHNAIPVTSGSQASSITLTGASTTFTPVQTVITATGTYNVPAGATKLLITCFGGGGGGGSGAVEASGVAAYGGAGGGGGGISQITLPVSAVTSSVGVNVGGAGTGGVAQAGPSANGNAGSAGGNTHFGTYLWAFGGVGGNGGGTTAPSAPNGGTGSAGSGSTGAAGGTLPNGNNNNAGGAGAGGGGAGGGVSTAPAAGTGGNGSIPAFLPGGGLFGAGGAAGVAGGNATASSVVSFPGTGGGGGGSSAAATGATGGNGAGNGGGGGGGGAALNGNGGSGAGGNGAPGAVIVYAS